MELKWIRDGSSAVSVTTQFIAIVVAPRLFWTPTCAYVRTWEAVELDGQCQINGMRFTGMKIPPCLHTTRSRRE
jgi:hypothetical protein